MHMTQLDDLMKLEGLKQAYCLKKKPSYEVTIRSVTVAPSLNVAEWGERDMAVLLPRPLFQERTEAQLRSFFRDAEIAGISLFLCPSLPSASKIADVYNEGHHATTHTFYAVPEDTSMEELLSNIRKQLFQDERQLLNDYRKRQASFSQFALHSPTYTESLRFFSRMIGYAVSLQQESTQKRWFTDPNYEQFQVIQTKELERQLNTGYPLEMRIVQYPFLPHAPSSQLKIVLPEINGEQYSLIVHHFQKSPQDFEWLILEQAAYFFQYEIQKNEALKKNELQHKNDLLEQLLKGEARSNRDLIEKAAKFGLSEEKEYCIVICRFYPFSVQKKVWESDRKSHVSQFLMATKIEFKKLVYMETMDRLVLVLEQRSRSSLKNKFQRIVDQLKNHQDFHSAYMNVSISGTGSVLEIPVQYRTAVGIQKLLTLLKRQNTVSTYEDLGVYQFFINSLKLQSYKEAIPEPLLKMQKEDPELSDTLRVFLEQNQNYKKTADLLYVHPKTVRYRMGKVRDEYGFQLENPQETLHIRLSLQLLEFEREEENQ